MCLVDILLLLHLIMLTNRDSFFRCNILESFIFFALIQCIDWWWKMLEAYFTHCCFSYPFILHSLVLRNLSIARVRAREWVRELLDLSSLLLPSAAFSPCSHHFSLSTHNKKALKKHFAKGFLLQLRYNYLRMSAKKEA